VALVDPVEPAKVLKAAKQNGVTPACILTTHHHADHAGGNNAALNELGDINCYGGDERVEGLTKQLKDNDIVKVGNLQVKALATAGHTTGHTCYYVEDTKTGQKAVFTGDCLFSSGCGRLFEGTAKQMLHSLDTIASLSDETEVYFGHEYTRKNLQFAEHVEPNNEDIKQKIAWANKTHVTTPSTVKNEKLTNPFMRVREQELRNNVLKSGEENVSDADVLLKVRKMKDNF
jgi:hydroxyacylglutathione hydrolase